MQNKKNQQVSIDGMREKVARAIKSRRDCERRLREMYSQDAQFAAMHDFYTLNNDTDTKHEH